jgi:hypothetical protein
VPAVEYKGSVESRHPYSFAPIPHSGEKCGLAFRSR